jgi:hypothetical protein
MAGRLWIGGQKHVSFLLVNVHMGEVGGNDELGMRRKRVDEEGVLEGSRLWPGIFEEPARVRLNDRIATARLQGYSTARLSWAKEKLFKGGFFIIEDVYYLVPE